MSSDWRGWCRLCATSGASGIGIFGNEDFVWPDRIIKYLSISVNDEDGMPQSVCDACCQRITVFDQYAEQCARVQAMFRAMFAQSDVSDKKVVLMRAEFLQDNDQSKGSKNAADNKMDIDLLAIDTDPFVPSENSGPPIKRTYKLKPGRKKNPRIKSILKNHKKPIISKIKIEDPERRSSRLQVLAQTQLDYGIDSSSEAKPELDNFVDSEIVLPRKRGRPPKRLVGAAKRKAKKPRVVKPKKNLIADEDFDDLGMEVKSENDKINQPSIFRWECHVCGEMARNWNSLSIHTRLVHEVPAQVLCLCAKVLSSRASIIKHRLKHTDGYKYKCEKCDKSFHRRGCYELHVLSHVPKEEQPFVCCKCARRFHCEALLRQHEKVHLPREERLIYPCTTCHKKFSSKSAVSAHIKSIHFGERPFVCDQCGHSFTSKGILQEHLTIHSDETPFKCQHCHKSFKTKYRLKIHLDIHRETPYQCPVCPLQLSTRRTLRMHLVVHKDTKAFQCSICGKAFRRAKDLKNHHNLHTGRRPYTCTFCPRTFANGSNCRSHKRRMHPEELRVYEAALAAAEHLANNPGAPPLPAAAPAATQPQQPLELPLPPPNQTQPMISQAEAMATQGNMNVAASSNQQMMSANQDFQAHAAFNEASGSMKSLLGGHTVRAASTMVNNYQGQNSVNRVVNSAVETQQGHDNGGGLHGGLRNNQGIVSRNNGHHYASTDDCGGGDRSAMNDVRRGVHAGQHGPVDGGHNSGADHIPTMAPLNLNISQLHAERHQMGSNMGMGESDRRVDNFHNHRSHMPNVNQGHLPNLTSNLHQLRQHQNFGLNRGGANDRAGNLNRPGRDAAELNRSITDRDLGNSNLNQMHHNSEHPNILQGYTSSLNHLYQHPSSVAAAMAHSSTVGVPAFPGNPYVHHGMGSALSNYQRGNGNL